jgi:hypothetical protein
VNDAFVTKYSGAGALLWSTYFGGGDDDDENGMTVTNGGLIYVAGQTKSNSGIATGSGHQTTFGGMFDAFLLKLDGTGSMLWSTYYGGITYECGSAVATDAAGNAFLVGYTDSPTLIASGGAYQGSFAGIYDAFVAKFDPTGTRLWGTYFGGTGDDYGMSANVDPSGNLYFSGQTASSASIATGGSHQTVWGGNNDAYLAKFNTNGGIIWCTYYGSSASETGYACAVDAAGNAYLGGQTTSTTSIATSGAQQTTYGGGPCDGFLAKFNSTGVRQWGTYYGDLGNDDIKGIVTDASSNVYFTGTTTSGSNISTAGSYQAAYGTFGDIYVVKLNSSSVRQWATYYGDAGNDTGNGMAIDASGKLFVTGVSSSSSNMTTTGAAQTSNGGSFDAILARFSNGCLNPSAPANTTPTLNLTVCSGQSATLTASGTGTVCWYNAPGGGTFLSSGNTYVTPTLTTNATFYIADSTACSSLTRNSVSVTVNPVPTPSFTLPVLDTLVCLTKSPFTLNGGSPSGGVYSGPGITGSIFTASVAGVGTYSLSYTYTNSFGCSAVAQAKIRVQSCSGIKENSLTNNALSIYPNPNNGDFILNCKIEGQFEIVNELGQTILSFDTRSDSKIPVNGLNSGTYFITGKTKEGIVKEKLVVIN